MKYFEVFDAIRKILASAPEVIQKFVIDTFFRWKQLELTRNKCSDWLVRLHISKCAVAKNKYIRVVTWTANCIWKYQKWHGSVADKEVLRCDRRNNSASRLQFVCNGWGTLARRTTGWECVKSVVADNCIRKLKRKPLAVKNVMIICIANNHTNQAQTVGLNLQKKND